MTGRQRTGPQSVLARALAVGVVLAGSTASVASAQGANDNVTKTPIKHAIYIIGENRTFDHLLGTMAPRAGQRIWNVFSEHIMHLDGTPGPNFAAAQQFAATDTGKYSIHPPKMSYGDTMPPVMTGGAPTSPPFATAAAAQAAEPGLPSAFYIDLASGGSPFPSHSVDTRFALQPANGPFQRNGPFMLTPSSSYHDYMSSPVHRFFQMWQQLDCDIGNATQQNPSGCLNDLFPWVEVTIGAGTNGKAQPAGFNDQSTGEGSTAMGLYNAHAGDAGYLVFLAQKFAVYDNYHQPIAGGTGANSLTYGFGSTIFYADSNGNPATPPNNQIENPDPQAGTNNWYTQDGYGGGSYVNCADNNQPGVGSITDYEGKLPYKVHNACQPNAYYLVNNYNPGYSGADSLGNGIPAPLADTLFTIPPSSQNHIGLVLNKHKVSWKYYGEGWAGGTELGPDGTGEYCNICNPFLYSKQTMTDPAQVKAHLKDIQDFYSDVANNSLPAVSFVKPDGYVDGHPASSRWDLFDGFVKKIVDKVRTSPEWDNTAIFITVDEGGGYWDSGYIQPVDFFGDGTRIPLVVVSKYSEGVGVVHAYGDHVSFDKFVEANWNLGETISQWSRDNLPNPKADANNPWVPTNAPAITDLMGMFNFGAH